jgi:hypothetical protein
MRRRLHRAGFLHFARSIGRNATDALCEAAPHIDVTTCVPVFSATPATAWRYAWFLIYADRRPNALAGPGTIPSALIYQAVGPRPRLSRKLQGRSGGMQRRQGAAGWGLSTQVFSRKLLLSSARRRHTTCFHSSLAPRAWPDLTAASAAAAARGADARKLMFKHQYAPSRSEIGLWLPLVRALLLGGLAAAAGALFAASCGALLCLATGALWTCAISWGCRGALAGFAAGAIVGSISGIYHVEEAQCRHERVVRAKAPLAAGRPSAALLRVAGRR